jgi:hypothetical protein
MRINGNGRKRVLKEKTMKKSANIVVEKGRQVLDVGQEYREVSQMVVGQEYREVSQMVRPGEVLSEERKISVQ